MSWLVADKPPKPSLSAWPSSVFKLGKDITLQCRGPLPGVEFVLEHDGEEAPQQFSEDGDFVINNVEGKGIGNYSCSYRLQAYPDIWSEPSEPLELVGAAGEMIVPPWLRRNTPGIPESVPMEVGQPWSGRGLESETSSVVVFLFLRDGKEVRPHIHSKIVRKILSRPLPSPQRKAASASAQTLPLTTPPAISTHGSQVNPRGGQMRRQQEIKGNIHALVPMALVSALLSSQGPLLRSALWGILSEVP